jgi:NADP-dependent 3-hydroxy acid dehydrogenase YdfG
MNAERKIAVITGASSGIGEATAYQLSKGGFRVIVAARRTDRLKKIAESTGGQAIELDVSSAVSVKYFAGQISAVNLLVNCAGGAVGLEPIADAVDEKWITMFETNVLGLMRVTRALLPLLIESGDGHIINIGSVAGLEAYPGGAGYTSAKHGVVAISQTLRQELVGKPVRVTEIDPGLVETEFSVVRFDGDTAKAANVYRGMTPLTASDVADAVVWAATRPKHVNIDQIVIKPLAQVSAQVVSRTDSNIDVF